MLSKIKFRVGFVMGQNCSCDTVPTTYSFRAFKPFYGDLKQPKQTKADQCRPSTVSQEQF